MRRMGLLVSPQGAPLSGRAVTVRNWATGAVVTTLTTDANGKWDVDLPDETKQYWIDTTFGGSSTQLAVQAPASIELEHLYVRYGAKLPAGTLIGGVTIDPGAPPGSGALDPRYVQKAGDTMAGALTLDYAAPTLTLRESDAAVDNRRVQLTQPSGDGRLRIQAVNDAGAAGATVVDFLRTGNNISGVVSGATVTINRDNDPEVAAGVVASAVAATGPRIRLRRSRGTIAVPTPTGDLDDLGAYTIEGRSSAGAWATTVRLIATASGANTATAQPASFEIGMVDAAGAMQSRLSINPAGNVTIPQTVGVGGNLNVTGGAAVTGLLTAAGGITLQRAGFPTHALMYLNNASQYLLWDATVLTLQGAPLVVSPTPAGLAQGLRLVGPAGATDASIALQNTTLGGNPWLITHEGSRAAYGPADSFGITKSGVATAVTFRPDGRAGFGGLAGGGATAQLDVQASAAGFLAFRALSRSDQGGNVYGGFYHEGGLTVIGATRNGPCFHYGVIAPNIAATRHFVSNVVPCYNMAGAFLGYMRLFDTSN